MGKQVNYRMSYINNADTVVLKWESKSREKIEYRVFSVKDGKSRLIGSTTENYLIFEPKDTDTVYIEARTVAGGLISESQKMKIPVNTDDIIGITAIKSFQGVTLSWSEKTLCGNYIILRKTDGKYISVKHQNIAQQRFAFPEKREIIRVAETDKNGNITRISSEFILKEGCFGETEAPSEVKLSVIIPAYNCMTCLSDCVDSVLASDMKELEIIIIDDGSTDLTGQIADWYAENYKGKVFAYHTHNQGAAMARNEGLKYARGEYVAFADSDDYVSADMYGKLYDNAAKLDCDIALSQLYHIMVPQINRVVISIDFDVPIEENKAHDMDELIKVLFKPKYQTMSVCNRICRTSLVREHPIPDLPYEDSAWTPALYSYAKNFCYISKPLYCYNRFVEAQKKTVSNDFAGFSEEERASKRILSYKYFIETGNPEKTEYLLAIALRLIHRQVARPQITEEAAKIFAEYIIGYIDKIRASKFISSDSDLNVCIKITSKKSHMDI